MASEAFDTLIDLIDADDLPPSLIAAADLPLLSRVRVIDRSASHTPLGTMFSFLLDIDGDVTFRIPSLPLSVVLGPAGGDGTLNVRAFLGDDWFIEVDRLAASLRFDPVLLRPVDPAQSFAEVRVESGVRLTPRTLQFTEPGLRLSLPPSEIPGTGIVVSLDGLGFDLSADSTPRELEELGYDASFQGVYAERATLRLLPIVRLGNAFGIDIDARHVVAGTSGVSCTIEQSFVVDRTDLTGPTAGTIAGWRFALETISGEIRDSDPTAISATGLIEVPLFAGLFDVSLGIAREPDGSLRYTARIASGRDVTIATPFGTIAYEELVVDAALTDTTVDATGVIAGLVVDLAPLAVAVEHANVQLSRRETEDELAIELRDVTLGPLGQLPLVTLVVTDRPGEERSVRVEATLSWRDLRARLQVPDYLPTPPDSATVGAVVSWHEDQTAGTHTMSVVLGAEVDDVDRLWAFLPQRARPEVRNGRLRLAIDYDSTATFAADTNTSGLTGSFGAAFEIRLPSLGAYPGSDLLTIHGGDDDGWIGVTLDASLDGSGHPSASASLDNLVTLDVQAPGLPQADAPLHLELTTIDFTIGGGGANGTGALTIGGRFDVRPLAPPATIAIAAHVQRLLAPIRVGQLAGEATLTLEFAEDRNRLAIDCAFDDARIDVDVFALLSNLAAGRPDLDGGVSTGAIELDLAVGFALDRLGVEIATGGDAPGASMELGLSVSIGDLRAGGHIRLSDRELAIGLSEAAIPLRMPAFPLTHDEVAALQTDRQWTDALTTRRQRIAALEARPDAANRGELAHLHAQEFLLSFIQAIRLRLAGAANRQIYQDGLETALALLGAVTGPTMPSSAVELVLHDVQLVFPFADPRDIRVEGGAHLRGFAGDDPLRTLEHVELGLGLSADRLFFSTATIGGPIAIPDLGRYPGGEVKLTRFTIGYGYTKNSLSVTFQGDVKLPRQLVRDADTSDSIGFGVRLPTHSSLGFKLDLIPVPGPLPVVPVFEFDIDLRSPAAPGIVATDTCEPFWDGVQLKVPEVFRADVKRLAFAPWFGPLPIPNMRFAGDLELGTEASGLTVVADNLLVLGGLYAGTQMLTIPFLADPAYPYFDNLCVHAQLAGFGVSFDIQRPFPSFSPLALFELLGLIADPSLELDANGALANSIRVSLKDARLTVPRAVLRLFPNAEAFAGKPLELTLNVATVVTALQDAVRTAGDIATTVEHGASGLARRLRRLADDPPELNVGALVAALPPDLRKLRLSGSFAGFDARALVVLADAGDLRAIANGFDARGDPPAAVSRPPLSLGDTVDPHEGIAYIDNVPSARTRTYDPRDPGSNPFMGIEFDAFTSDDVRAIPPPRASQAGVIVAAHVKVFEGQRLRFLGALYEDGSFALISAANLEPVRLRVLGIPIALPIRAAGRLTLAGRARRDGYHGRIEADVTVHNWSPIPNVLRLDIGLQKPAALRLTSEGRFSFSGDARATLFGGAATIDGRADLSEAHCFISGRLAYAVGVIRLDVDGRGRVGPDRRFELAGRAALSVGGVPLTSVRAEVTESSARIEGRLKTKDWRVGGQALPCSIDVRVAGALDLRKRRRPSFLLEGNGTLTCFDASIRGRASLRSSGSRVAVAAEGALRWQNREWLGGSLEIGDRSVTIAGRTSLAFDLTPGEFASGVQIANLFFKLDVEGRFTLNANGGLRSFARVRGDWLLAAQFPGTAKRRQAFPLAMQRFDVGGGISLNHKLFEVRGLTLLPTDLTLPGVEVDSTVALTFHKHGVSIPGVGDLVVYIPRIPDVHTPNIDPDPFPFPLGSSVSKQWRTAVEIPTSFKFSKDALTIPSTLNFNVFLVCNPANGRLGIEVRPT